MNGNSCSWETISESLPFDERLQASLVCRNDKVEKKGGKKLRQWHHPLLNTIDVFGNTSGCSVFGGADYGGTLLSEISVTFERYISSKSNVFERKTFQELFNPIKRKLHQNQYGNQVVQLQDTLNGIEVYILPKKE